MTNDITITKSGTNPTTNGSYTTVSIFTTDVTEDITKDLIFIDQFASAAKQQTKESGKTIIDMYRRTRTFTINGYISATDSRTASQQKQDLLQISDGGGVVSMTYSGNTYTCAVTKLTIREVSTDNTIPLEYNVKIVFTQASLKGG